MSHLITIYAPDGEPFEVTADKVGELCLNKGFSRNKPDPDAEPAVTTVAKTTPVVEDGEVEGWREQRMDDESSDAFEDEASEDESDDDDDEGHVENHGLSDEDEAEG